MAASVKSDTSKKPPRTEIQQDNIPPCLKVLPRWVVWRWTLRGEKWQKPPRQTNDANAQSNNPETWTTFEKAHAAWDKGNFDGIGIVLPDNFVGVDLDNCRNRVTGGFTTDAQVYLAMANTYTEISPSGEGIKSICTGRLNRKLRNVSHERGVEMYDGGTTNRYFTITGDVVDESHGEITGQRGSLYNLQCMINDPIEEVLRVEERDISDDLQMARVYLEYLKPERARDYHDWLQVGMALHSISDDPLLIELWDEWSQQSDSYGGVEDIENRWASFSRDRSGGRIVSMGSLKRMAREDGFREAQYATKSITLTDLLAKNIERNYLITNMLVEREPMIIGAPSKTLKTTLALDFAVSLATGTNFLGVDQFEVPEPQRVMLISGESGDATLQENFQVLVTERFGDELPSELDNLHVSFTLPKLDDVVQVEDLIKDMKERNCRVLIVDPLYRSLRAGDSASNVYAMGDQLDLISTMLHAHGITTVLLHHFRKQGKTHDSAPDLEELSMSGVAEFGRQFILLKRRKEYQMDGEHQIWMSWGGSAGHQGLKVLEASTGTRTTGVRWKVNLLDVKDIEAGEHLLTVQREAEEQEVSHMRVLNLVPHDKPRAKKDIKEDLGIPTKHAEFSKMIAPLVAAEFIEEHDSGKTLVRSGAGDDRLIELKRKYESVE